MCLMIAYQLVWGDYSIAHIKEMYVFTIYITGKQKSIAFSLASQDCLWGGSCCVYAVCSWLYQRGCSTVIGLSLIDSWQAVPGNSNCPRPHPPRFSLSASLACSLCCHCVLGIACLMGSVWCFRNWTRCCLSSSRASSWYFVQVDKKKREKKDRKKGIKGKWQKNRAERESKNKTALSGKITVSDILNEIQFVSLYQRNCFFVTLWIITVVFQKQKWESAAAKALQTFLLEEVIGASLMYKGCKSVLASFSHVSNNYAILTK